MSDTGLPAHLLSELLLKVMQQSGLQHLQALAQHLRLLPGVVEEVLAGLRRDSLVEIRWRGALDGDVEYELTQAGRTRAVEAEQRNRYAGPAPVSLKAYVAQVQTQAVRGMRVTRPAFEAAMAAVIMRPEVREQLGTAMNSRRSILLYGPPGSGKTYLCEQVSRMLAGPVAVPYAVEVSGEIVRVYDPLVHQPAAAPGPSPEPASGALDSRMRPDARWVLCERPVVVTGGELTLEMLELMFDERAGFYQAPPHVKANNGLYLVDDLGRQRVSPRELLNRWIVPMEQYHDHLVLRSGAKFKVPFDCLLFFSTNLTPADVADEAFLRRIGHKIFLGEVAPAQYGQLLREACADTGVGCDEGAVEHLLALHRRHGRPLLASAPRDLVSHVSDHAAYHGLSARLSPDLLERAWHNQFASSGGSGAAPTTTRHG
ncbi:AAA family ATPase [Caldimonas tepidiphila]|uniref:AAA family ATPase n=1 Tax=Caldimonas tepidiphila TaxID=2315841 RepID=UPI00196ADF08|nr:AAA family ATPase [Caldimonas tepidiphila]